MDPERRVDWAEPQVNLNPPDRTPFLLGSQPFLRRSRGAVWFRLLVALLLLSAALTWIARHPEPVNLSLLGIDLHFAGPLRDAFWIVAVTLYFAAAYYIHPNLEYIGSDRPDGCSYGVVQPLLLATVFLWPARFVLESVLNFIIMLQKGERY